MLFEFDDHVIVLGEVALVVKSNLGEYLKSQYPNESEYNVYFKNSSQLMGIREMDIERFKAALRDYYKTVGDIMNKESVMIELDLSSEKYREYDFGGRIYRIDSPKTLYYRASGSTHRVLDSEGVVHCVPAPGSHGCVLRWESKDPRKPVEF